MGDFYEMFFEDAVTASRVLEITLTSRNKNKEDAIPLCGFPYHAASAYIAKLIEKGFKVAVCEQMEDPKLAKGVVKREVIRVVTPGLVLDTENLNAKENNYLAALVVRDEPLRTGLCRHLHGGIPCHRDGRPRIFPRADVGTSDPRTPHCGGSSRRRPDPDPSPGRGSAVGSTACRRTVSIRRRRTRSCATISRRKSCREWPSNPIRPRRLRPAPCWPT